MGIAPAILTAKVMHARLFPARNAFTYGLYYIALPLDHDTSWPIARNRPALMSFYDRDHGACDGSPLLPWAQSILKRYGLDTLANGKITLICMPRILGYTFNPVSFWLCRDADGNLRAVICEVHNTFGEYHAYLCAHPDHRPITGNDVLRGDKVFHVSPFLKRDGRYDFVFDCDHQNFKVWIDYFDGDGQKQLVTSLTGTFQPMTPKALRAVFWRYPLVTFRAIYLIHWQALKLMSKGIKYILRPKQAQDRISPTDNVTEI
jgi:DUF1365 family protein